MGSSGRGCGVGAGQPAGKASIWSAVNKSDLWGQLEKEEEEGDLRRPQWRGPILTWVLFAQSREGEKLWDKGGDPRTVASLPDGF